MKPGKYVLAVSGGVDSVVLLDILSKRDDLELIIAHFDHGIRKDSAEDMIFVRSLAKKHGLPFEYAEGRLGQKASEADARRARYDFLREIHNKYDSDAVVTAHHQDDVLETAVINILRGTGRKGISSLNDSGAVRRPLLGVRKHDIVDYARSHDLDWREDSTNEEDAYLRNYVRIHLLPNFSEEQKNNLLDLVSRSSLTNDRLDSLLNEELDGHLHGNSLNRAWLKQLPHDLSREVMAAWLRRSGIRNFDRRTLERLVVSAKTGRHGQRFDVINGNIMRVEKDFLALDVQER